MDIHDLIKKLEHDKENLAQILKGCNNGPDELVLLASKMGLLLEDFSAVERELFHSDHTLSTPPKGHPEPDSKS